MILLLVSLCGFGLAAVYYLVFSRFVSADPDEWMLVVRDGEVISAGVGISRFIRKGDQVVKFPSKINKVNFAAQQVTKEVQGVEIGGALIWSIFREKDGPIRAYKFLGEDIKNPEPFTANEYMVEMSNAIVRHRIANSTIDEILRNRDLIRSEIRAEMNKIVNGWGVWLESVEITDVKILSGSLFSNMQMPFREEQRIKAENIRMDIEAEISQKQIEANKVSAKTEAERQANNKIYTSEQNLRVLEENQKNAEAETELKKKENELKTKLKELTQESEAQMRKEAKEREKIAKMKEVERKIAIETKRQELERIKEQGREQLLKAKIERKEALEAQMRKITEDKTSALNALKKKGDYRFAVLNACQTIYSQLPLQNVNLLNFETSGKDPIHSLADQLITGINKFEKVN